MEAFSSFSPFQSTSRGGWSYESLKNFRQISPLVQNHLKQVYLTLCCALIASAIGVYLHLLWNIGGLLTTLGCMGSIVWLLSTPLYEERKRVGLLMAAGLFEGASVGPLIDVVIRIDQRILISAFVGTSVAFGCFSAAAMLARRREFLYLGGLLSSGLSILLWLHFASSIFGGSTAIFKFELYFGLLVFLGYMVVDTQEIIERAHLGELDYVKHALTLFTDFVAVFVRVLVIMLKNAGEREEKEKRKRRN
ncbi:PREDICTED: bax inhibitor 1 [Nelumbo nucifera]|uniref:Bax inhibitor 1 n=1 Tax=Nelumbo nucifera TaxID=4432 RepID=A0A1U8B3Q9_NELNU|nr:PREDICTED: bax inhibitor 1 [Nelumbo nucifera]